MAKGKKTKGTRAGRSRRGKGEDHTEAKANAVEVRKGSFSQEELKLPAVEDYSHHKKNIVGSLEKLETAKSLYRKALQSAKAAGIDTDAMLEARRIVRANDPKGTAQKLNQLAFCLEQEGFSIQITVHDTLAGDEMDMVYRRYFQDGKDGKTLDNRYPEGSDLAAQAARAWRHGMSSNAGVSVEEADKTVDEDTAEIESRLPPPPAMGESARITH